MHPSHLYHLAAKRDALGWLGNQDVLGASGDARGGGPWTG
jgi:hypothetical protein